MKILFVYANFYGMNMLPTAIGLLTSCLKEIGHTVELFDTTTYANWHGSDNDVLKQKNLSVRPYDDSLIKKCDKFGSPIEDFKRLVQSYSPDLIALSMTEDMYFNALELLSELDKNDRPHTVAGGVFPTFAPELVLRRSNKLIDYVLIGEGEHTLPDFCNKLKNGQPLNTVEGIWYIKKDNSIYQSKPPTAINVNQDVPIPDFDHFEESRFYRPLAGKLWKMVPIETHRGCPYTCAYCNSPSQNIIYGDNKEQFFRKKKMALVRKELASAINKYQANSFMFWADTFLAWKDNEFEEFCDMYSEFKLPFWIQTRPETVTEYRFKKLKDIGLMRVDFGLEHGNAEFRKKVLLRRGTNEDVIRKLDIASDTGVLYAVNNIMGFPKETRELAFDTIELNRHIKADGMNAYTFTPFHGIPLRSMAEVLGYIAPGEITSSVLKPTMLRMPHWSQSEISGLVRCFVLYAKLPKSRWPDIKKAEESSPEGDRVWHELKQELLDEHKPWHDIGEEKQLQINVN